MPTLTTTLTRTTRALGIAGQTANVGMVTASFVFILLLSLYSLFFCRDINLERYFVVILILNFIEFYY